MTIDTETDSYQQAIGAVQAAYGLRPDVPADWLDAPTVEPSRDRKTWLRTTSGTAGRASFCSR
ncbi:hypothetical protein GCM10010320_81150 [Streptomyces caelestis]|nr:hypothetical protein GCM10010320_81150 [Streptomyces caelestis]